MRLHGSDLGEGGEGGVENGICVSGVKSVDGELIA